MAEADDSIEIRAKLTRLDEAVEAIENELVERLDKASAAGERALETEYQAQLDALRQGRAGSTTRGAAEVSQQNAALQQQRAIQDELIAGDERRLALIREQIAAQQQLAAAMGESAAVPARAAAGAELNPAIASVAEQEAALARMKAAAEQRQTEREMSGMRDVDPAAEAAVYGTAPSGARGEDERATRAVNDSAAAQLEREAEAARRLAEEQREINELTEQYEALATQAGGVLGLGVAHALDEQERLNQQATEYEARLAAAAEQQARIASYAHQASVAYGVADAQEAGRAAAGAGVVVPAAARRAIIAGPPAEEAGGAAWTQAEQALVRYEMALSEYETFTAEASLSTGALTANMTRLGVAEAQAGAAMRTGGEMSAAFLGQLARGETTLSEFGAQLAATAGKFGGWAAAAALTYGAFEAVSEFGRGALDSSNEVDQLKRTIDGLNTQKAASNIRSLSQDTDVSVKDAGEAVFQFSRTFHNLDDATTAARLGLAAYQLDNVQVADSVKMVTAIHQQFGTSAAGMANVYNMLASGQREYNARISDMIPLLQKSTGAIRNSGGDLNQLIQVGAVALRTTQQSGQQVGTALYRAASSFVPKNAGQLVTQYGLGGDIDALTGKGNVTQLIQDAIRESATMSGPRRRNLANLIFGPQYGGRLGALFGPESSELLNRVTTGKDALTPAATKGSLQTELDTQLDQTKKRLDQFGFSLERLGSALASSGALAPLGLLVRGLTSLADGFTKVLSVFSLLPGSAREVVTGMLAIRTAMMFFSRTRLGSSAPLITRVPGFRPSEATQARASLAMGTRTAINASETELRRVNAALTANAAEQATLGQQRAAILGDANSADELTAEQLERANAISARIDALQGQQARMTAERTAQLAQLEALQQQQVRLTATSRRVRGDDAWVLGLQRQVQEGTNAADDAGGASAGLPLYFAQRKKALAERLRSDTAATKAASSATDDAAAAATADAGATDAMTARLTLQEAALASATAAADGATAALRGAGARVAGMIGAIDPMLIGLIAVPFIYGEISSTLDEQNRAVEEAQRAANAPIDSVAALESNARKNRAAASHLHQAAAPSNLLHRAVTAGEDAYDYLFKKHGDTPTEKLNSAANQSQMMASEMASLGHAYQYLDKSFQKEAESMASTTKGREQLRQRILQLQGAGNNLADIETAMNPKQQGAASVAFVKSLQQIYDNATAKASGTDSAPDFSKLVLSGQLAPKTIEQQLQAWEDASKVFGTNSQNLKKAEIGYAALQSRFGNASDDTTLQAIYTAQQNLVQAVAKNVQDWLDRASTATTNAGQQQDLNAALNQMTSARSSAAAAFAEIFKRDKDNAAKLRQDHAAYDQVTAQFASEFASVVQAQLTLMQSESAVASSQVQGISPASDIRREQVSLQGLRQQLAWAQSHGADAQTVNNLQSQLNNAQLQLQRDQISNARNIISAQGQLESASITGISPAADIARAQATVNAARQMLAFDQAHNEGPAQIMQDQASLDSALHDLYSAQQQYDSQLAQNAQALIAAQAALSESETVNPVTQARDALKADMKSLGTIKPQDYQTYSQYQAALLQQKAKVNQDKVSLQQQIYEQDLNTLKYQLATEQISDAQYIDGLQKLLKMKKLTLADRQNIEEEIFNTLQEAAVNVNVGNIKPPTAYEVRSAIQNAMKRGSKGVPQSQGTYVNQPTTVHNNVVMNIRVAKDSQVKQIADVLRTQLTSAQAQARAAGIV